MFYRLAGVYRTSYAADRALFQVPADRCAGRRSVAAALGRALPAAQPLSLRLSAALDHLEHGGA